MNTVLPTPRVLLTYLYVGEDGNIHKIGDQNIPSSAPIPNVGDEIGFPEGAIKNINISTSDLKILKRRFLFTPKEGIAASILMFVSDQER